MNVLNPELYNALKRRFGDVGVSNAGVPLQWRSKFAADGIARPGKPRRKVIEVQHGGEQYTIRCPFCNDYKKRLWVSHAWDTTVNGTRVSHLIHCFRSECQNKPGMISEFRDMLSSNYTGGGSLLIQPTENITIGPKQVKVPGEIMAFKELPDSHSAVAYMQSRGFDKTLLSDTWDVRWCFNSSILPPHNRIVFPIFWYVDETDEKPTLVGTQSRYFNMLTRSGEPTDNEVKWFTQPGTKKASVLYNGHRARNNKDLVVIVEGPLDAIKVGPDYSVALFGKDMSFNQAAVLNKVWGRNGAIAVVLLDDDAYVPAPNRNISAVDKAKMFLKEFEHIVCVRLPEENDPGETPTEQIWEHITTGIKTQIK